MFWPAGVDERVAGVIEWSREEGARVELIGQHSHQHGWPRNLGTERVAIHGLVNGRKLSLLDAWVSRMTIGDIPSGLYSPTVIVGSFCTGETVWLEAILATANLSEWRSDTGIRARYHMSRGAKYPVQVRWQVPTKDRVRLTNAELIFEGTMASTGVSTAPSWSMDTWQRVVIKPDRPTRLVDLYRRYAAPLVSFTSFVSDRPDAITDEALVSESRSQAAVLRQRSSRVEPRAWRLDDQYLFPVEVLDDYAGAISRWWELFEQTWPALGMFAEHINEGTTYSPARFLTLYTAVEAYSRVRHEKKDFQKLREYAGLPTEVTGCTKDALALIGVSRKYFAHLGGTGSKYSLSDVEDNAMESTRRLSALMQACLMRELGISTAETAELMTRHYMKWPIP